MFFYVLINQSGEYLAHDDVRVNNESLARTWDSYAAAFNYRAKMGAGWRVVSSH